MLQQVDAAVHVLPRTQHAACLQDEVSHFGRRLVVRPHTRPRGYSGEG